MARKSVKKTKKKTSAKKTSQSVKTLKFEGDRDIAMDFALKVYKKFDTAVKSILLFGSAAKHTQEANSDIDIVIIVDDASIKWDTELIAWYREELEKILEKCDYEKTLHINTIKLTTWWNDLIKGDPVVLNILRYGDVLVDSGGFFKPLKLLLLNGMIRSTPEAVYAALSRAPVRLTRSRIAELSSLEEVYWAMVDTSQAILIALNVIPPSPEHLFFQLKENLVDRGLLKEKYLLWFRDLSFIHKKIAHNELKDLSGINLDSWRDRAEEYFEVVTALIKKILKI